MERRRECGGILQLLDLIRDHRGALEYDLRSRLHLALTDIGRAVSWGEGCRLVRELLIDPGTHLFAAVAGWEHPVSHEWLVLVSLRNAFVRANFKDPDRWPVPWPSDAAVRIGTAAEQVLTQEQIDRVLRNMSGR